MEGPLVEKEGAVGRPEFPSWSSHHCATYMPTLAEILWSDVHNGHQVNDFRSPFLCFLLSRKAMEWPVAVLQSGGVHRTPLVLLQRCSCPWALHVSPPSAGTVSFLHLWLAPNLCLSLYPGVPAFQLILFISLASILFLCHDWLVRVQKRALRVIMPQSQFIVNLDSVSSGVIREACLLPVTPSQSRETHS